MQRSAGFSRCGGYRYWLKRQWSTLPGVTLVGLNPSSADARKDDATLRRVIGFARDWGFGAVTLVNLFAWRTPRPAELKRAEDPIGPRNNYWLHRVTGSGDPVVVAWGNHGSYQNRDQFVLAMIDRPLCIDVTRAGHPRHPLYSAGACQLSAFPRHR